MAYIIRPVESGDALALADIRRAGYRRVMLWVFRDNTRARGFYEKKGFVCNGRTQPSFGIEEVCYQRELPEDME